MAEVISTVEFDINTNKAAKNVETLLNSITRLDAELQQLQKEGKDTAAVEAQLARSTAQLNAALSQTTATTKGATAQAQAYAKAQRALAQTSEQTARGFDAVDIGGRKAASTFRRSVAGAKEFGKTVAQDVAGNIGNLKNGVQGLGDNIAGIASNFGAWGIAIAAVVTVLTPFIASLFEATAVEKSLAAATQAAIEQTAQEQAQLQLAIGTLRDTTASYTERRDAIDSINKLFPNYFANINLEKASQEELNQVYRVGTFLIQERAIKQAAAAEQQKVFAEQFKLQAAAAAQIAKEVAAFDERERLLQSESKKGVEERRNALIEAQKQALGLLDFEDSRIKALQDAEKIALELLRRRYKEDELLAIDNAKKQAELSARRQDQNKAIRDTTASLKEQKKELSEAPAKVYVNSLAELRRAASELRKVVDEQIDVNDIATITVYSQRIAVLEEEIRKIEKAIADANKAPLNLVPPKQNEAATKALRADIEALRLELGDAAIERNRALLNLQTQENEALRRAADNEQQKEAIRKSFAQRREQLERSSSERTLQTQIQIAEQELALLQASGDAEVGEIQQQIAKVQELQLELAKLQGEPIKVNVEVNTKTAQEKAKEAILAAADFAEQLGGQIIDFVGSANQAALQAAENAVSRQQAVLDELLNNRETANAQQVELERERLEKLNAEREKAKNQEAIIAQAQIAINLALAVARAAAEGGGIASAVTVGLAISAAVFGFLKAKQASEQAFFDGTLYAKRGAGEPAGRDTIKARLNEGEAVIPTATNRQYHPAVKAIYENAIPAPVLNAFVTDYRSGRVSPRALRAVQDSRSAPAVIMVQPDQSIGEKVAEEIRKMPQTQLRGDGIYRIVRTKSAKIEKTQKRAKGY